MNEQILIELTREALKSTVEGPTVGEIEEDFWQRWAPANNQRLASEPDLLQLGAVFVTLTQQDGSLRGCIGSLQPSRPLWQDAAENASSAAVRDPRFPPVRPLELGELQLEISVLGSPSPLQYTDADDLIAKLRPGVDGVVLSLRGRRATFLPQVWEQLPSPERFLSQLCRKAGLYSGSWREEHPVIKTYQVHSIGPVPAVAE